MLNFDTAFCFCLAQFFCTVCVIFYLDGNFVLYFHFVKHGCGILPLIFTAVKCLLLQTRRCVHKICVKIYAFLCFIFIYRTFALHNFFVPYALFLYLDGNFVLYFHFVKHGCGILPLIFTAKSHRLCKHGVAYIKFVLKNIHHYTHYCALFLYVGLWLCTIFLYRMRYFCTLTVILFCIFTLLNTVAVVLPLIFTTVKYLF